MKNSIAIIFIIIFINYSCNVTKKNKTTTKTNNTTNQSSQTASKPVENNIAMAPPLNINDGIYAPGEYEVRVLQMQYADITLDKLTTGYTIYTTGACIGCHSPKNIYKYTETSWKNIVNDMAVLAKISEEQKDAVYKYVLSIKGAEKK